MDYLQVADTLKQAILLTLHRRRPLKTDLSVDDFLEAEGLRKLNPDDRAELFETAVEELLNAGVLLHSFQRGEVGQVFDARITERGVLQVEADYPDPTGPNTDLLRDVSKLRSILISVATGGPRIQALEADYQELFARVATGLQALGIDNPISFSSLWDWYGRWSSGDLPSWQSRRRFVGELVDPLIATIRAGKTTSQKPAPTGWPRVDRVVGKARDALAAAKVEEDFQGVGHLCREILISLAQAVFDPALHPTEPGLNVSETDFKRLIDAYINVEIAGGQSEETRKHAKSALDLANKVLHRRTANFQDAAICLEATTSTVNIIAIVSGRRNPSSTNGRAN